jgi:hypothetical protein
MNYSYDRTAAASPDADREVQDELSKAVSYAKTLLQDLERAKKSKTVTKATLNDIEEATNKIQDRIDYAKAALG